VSSPAGSGIAMARAAQRVEREWAARQVDSRTSQERRDAPPAVPQSSSSPSSSSSPPPPPSGSNNNQASGSPSNDPDLLQPSMRPLTMETPRPRHGVGDLVQVRKRRRRYRELGRGRGRRRDAYPWCAVCCVVRRKEEKLSCATSMWCYYF
jgi:hypothetical protein